MATIAAPRVARELNAQVLSDASSETNKEKASNYFDLAIAILLHSWAPLTVAVTSSWGGPDSADKRDWFAGVLSDLFTDRPDTDVEDVEAVILQVMQDEFDVRLEDQSEEQLAADVIRWRRKCFEFGAQGWADVDKMRERWEEREGKKKGKIEIIAGSTEGREDEWSDDEDEDGGVDVPMDVVMEDKPEPEVDEEGFTKVTGRRKR